MLTALVVDHEENIRWILAAELEDKAYLVQKASSGAIALQLVGEQKPDVIFLDVMMPFMDGFDLISTLRENPETSQIPVVLITGLSRPHCPLSFSAVGMSRTRIGRGPARLLV